MPRAGATLFDIDAGADTFVTGGGLPGQARRRAHAQESDSDEDGAKHFTNLEDELEDQVNGVERDMVEMMQFLNECEDMMGGNRDLQQIQAMIDCSEKSLNSHCAAYGKLKGRFDDMNSDSLRAMQDIAHLDRDAAKYLQRSQAT